MRRAFSGTFCIFFWNGTRVFVWDLWDSGGANRGGGSDETITKGGTSIPCTRPNNKTKIGLSKKKINKRNREASGYLLCIFKVYLNSGNLIIETSVLIIN